MKGISCLTSSQIKTLEKSYNLPKGTLSPLADLKDIVNLKEHLNKIKDLNELKEDNELLNKFVKEAESLSKKNIYFVTLKTGTNEKKDVEKGFSWYDLDAFSEMFSSSFISLYRHKQLSSLIDIKGPQKDLKTFFYDFLYKDYKSNSYPVDSKGKLIGNQNLANLKAITEIFGTKDYPYKDIENDIQSRVFYGDTLMKLMRSFLAYYSDFYFKPNIFNPYKDNIKQLYPNRPTEDILSLDPKFKNLSKNKDILTGFIIESKKLGEELNSIEGLEAKAEFIKNSNFYNLLKKIMESFKFNDASTSTLFEMDREGNEEEEEEETFRAVDENASRSFEFQGNERTGFQSSSNETRAILASLFDIKNDTITTDDFGIPMLVNSFTVYKKLSKTVRGAIDYKDFYNKLSSSKNIKDNPFVSQLLKNYLIDPEDTKEVERLFKFGDSQRFSKFKVKQSLLQDLTKDEVIAKEIVLDYQRPEWNKKEKELSEADLVAAAIDAMAYANTSSNKKQKSKGKEKININVLNAKLRGDAAVFNDSKARFGLNYILNKNPFSTVDTENETPVFINQTLIDNSGYIKITSWYQAEKAVKNIQKQIKTKIPVNYTNVVSVLNILGIMPNTLDSNTIIKLYIDNIEAINTFFKKLPKRVDLVELVNIITKADPRTSIRNGKIEVNRVIAKFKNRVSNESNIKEVKKLLLGLQSTFENKLILPNVKEGDLTIVENINNEIKEDITNYLNTISSLFKVSDNKISDFNQVINRITNRFQEEISTRYTENLNKFFKTVGNNLFLNISDPINSFSNSPSTGLQKLYTDYSKYEQEKNTQYDNDMIVDHNGKDRSQVQLNNNVLIKTRDINEGREKMLTRFPDLDHTKNPNLATSIIYNQLFKIDPSNDSVVKSSSTSQLEVNNLLGVKLSSKILKTGSIGITDLNREDNALSSMLLLLFNGNEKSINGDKASAVNIRFSKFDRSKYESSTDALKQSNAANEFLPINAEQIAKLYTGTIDKIIKRDNTESRRVNLSLSENAVDNLDPIAKIFSKYLAGYLLTYYEVEKGNMKYVKDYYKFFGKNYDELGLFEKDSSKTNGSPGYIIDKKLKDTLKEKVLELKLNKKSVVEKIEAINKLVQDTDFQQFKSDLLNFFNTQVESVFDGLGSYSTEKEELSNLISLFREKSEIKNGLNYYEVFKNAVPGSKNTDQVSYDKMLKAIIMTYVVNFNILTQEKMLLYFGDPLFLKKSTYVKRVSGSNGTGNYCLIDDFDIEFFNDDRNTSAFGYAKAINEKLIKEGKTPINMDLHKLGYTFRFGQVSDNYVSSDTVFENLKSGFERSIKLKYPGISDSELKTAVKRSLDPYKNINEADGFGVITFDWYRIFSILTNSWTAAQDDLYKRIIAGEKVDEGIILTTFPVKKFSYVGATFLKDQHLPADTTHKYSLAPLIPGYGDINLQIKHENLIKEGKAYEIFDSASKRETLTASNPKNKFYDDAKSRTIKPLEANKKGEYVSGKDTVFAITNLLKDQVYIDPAIKTKSILARQLKRIIKTDLYNEGVPSDYEGTKQEWDKLKDKEKREKSMIHATYRNVMDVIGKINANEEDILLEQFGMSKSVDSGKVVYTLVDKNKLFNTIKKEMASKVSKQTTGSGNIYTKLLNLESKKEDANIEAFSNLNALKSTIKSLIEKNTKLRKYNGSNLIQSPITGSEPVTFNKENIAVDRNGYLKFYEFGEEKTKKAEVMVTFSEKWAHLLTLKHNGYTIRTIDKLNKALEDPNWVKENEDKLSILAVRVPIQDPNSIEGFIIKRFLPMTAGSKIVVPSEIVAKAGSDFDIDKLMVYFFNVNEDGEVKFDNSMEGMENQVIKGYLDLLLLPEMFYKLITANSVASLKKTEDKEDTDKIWDKLSKKKKSIVETYDQTDLRTPMLNIDLETLLQEQKKLVGHGATIRSNFEELKHSGFTSDSEIKIKINPFITKFDRDRISQYELDIDLKDSRLEKTAAIRFPFKMVVEKDGKKIEEPAYNQLIDAQGRNVISLSSVFNKKGTPISELISATMNGFLDIANDTWITILGMNQELTSLNYFMLIAGIPEEIVFSFNNQPIINQFIKNKLSLKESLFKRLLNPNRDPSDTRIIYDTFTTVLNSLKTKEVVKSKNKEGIEEEYEKFILSDSTKEKIKQAIKNAGIKDEKGIVAGFIDNYDSNDIRLKYESNLLFKINIEAELLEAFSNLNTLNFITEDELLNSINVKYNDMSESQLSNQFKLLAFLPFIKNYSESLTRFLQAEDFDKSKSQYVHDDYSNKQTITQLKRDSNFPKEVIKEFEKLSVSAKYDMSNLTTSLFAAMAPITENKYINTYAIRLYKYLGENKKRFVSRKNKDRFINAFKFDFVNFIVQNYGTILDNKVEKNIVQYLIDNSVFADKSISKTLLSSGNIDDQSVATKLFTVLDSFSIFKELEVFKYLNNIRVSRIGEDEVDGTTKINYLYKIGRVFKNLSPVELDNFNKEIKNFSDYQIGISDALQAIEESNGEVLYRFLEDLSIEETINKGTKEESIEIKSTDIDKILSELNELKKNKELRSFANISLSYFDKDSLTPKIIKKFISKVNKTKGFVTKVLPYMSLVQSPSTYSNTYISNLFVNRNYNIVKEVLNNFITEQGVVDGTFNWEDALNNYLPLFLLNNRNLISNDKEIDLLSNIAGGESFTVNNTVTAANFFNNYYKNQFSIYSDKNSYDSNVLDTILDSADQDNLFSSFIKDMNKVTEDLENGVDADLSDVEGVENSLTTADDTIVTPEEVTLASSYLVTLDNGSKFTVLSKSERVKNEEGILLGDSPLRNEVLINYYRMVNQLKSSNFNGKNYFVLKKRIIDENFESIEKNKKEILKSAILVLDCNIKN